MKSGSWASFCEAAPLEIYPGEPDDPQYSNRLYCRECGARIQDDPTDGGDVIDIFYDPEDYGAPRKATAEEIASGEYFREVIDPLWECPRCMTEHEMDAWQWG